MSMSQLVVFAVVAVASLARPVAAQVPQGPPAAPKSLLIFYCHPSLINGSNGDVAAAQKHFAKYDYVVIGDGLQNPKHPDHAKTVEIVKAAKDTTFFGYVDLGVSTTNLPQKEMEARFDAWAKMGVRGVLLDEFGYDFKVTRARQDAAVEAAHKRKLRVIANAWKPEDAFGEVDGKPPALTKDDIYLWESYRFQEGVPVPVDVWRKKAESVAELRKKIPFGVFSVSTTKEKAKNRQELFEHQWWCAALDGHAATGWGEPVFAAWGGEAPYTPSPVGKSDLGRLAGEIERKDAVLTRPTTTGRIEIDAARLTGKLVPKGK